MQRRQGIILGVFVVSDHMFGSPVYLGALQFGVWIG